MAIFDRNDILFLVFGGLLFIFGFFGFFKVNENPHVLREANALASIMKISGEVKQKPYGALSWFEASDEMPLYLWDEVFTQEGSEVEIEFDSGGTVIALEENSLIKIEQFGDDFQLDLIRGGLKVKKASGENNIRIESWGESVDVMSSSQKEGSAFIVASSSGIQETDQVPKRKKPLTSFWEGVSRTKSLTGLIGEKLSLPGKAEQNRLSYKVTAPNGEEQIYQNESSLNFNIVDEGLYRLELTSVDGNPLQEKFVHSFKVEVEKSLQVPPELSNQKLSVHKNEKAKLGVERARTDNAGDRDEKSELIYEVYNQDKSQLVKSFKSKAQFQELAIKSPGVFYWRVRREKKSQSGETVSEVSNFEKIIVKKPLISEGSINKEQTQWATDSVTKGDLRLNWKLEGEIQGGYQVVVSKDDKGEDVVERMNLSELDENVHLKNLKVGKYYWALIPQNETQDIYSETPFYEVNLRSPPRVKNLPIKDKQVMTFMPDKNGRFHRIELPQIKNAEEYHLEVFLDPSLTKLVHRDITKNPVSLWESERSGEFHYRYRVKDKWGRMSPYSETARLYFPISPTEDW